MDTCYSPTAAAINRSVLNFGFDAMKEGASALAMASRSALLGMLLRIASAMAMKCLRVMCVLQVKCALMVRRQTIPYPPPQGHIDAYTHPVFRGCSYNFGKKSDLEVDV